MNRMVTWDSEQYLRFNTERTQPSRDLAAQLPAADAIMRVLDIGCGPGNSTAVLRERYPHARILGVDSSPDMIAAARAAHPDIDFALCDVSQKSQLDALPHDFDVVFSNACIQWVPDHPHLIPNLLGLLREGGTLAVQTPMNYEEPIHRIIAELVHSPRYADRLPQQREFFNLTPPDYWELLHAHAVRFRMWKTTYMHTLPSHEAIMDWYRGTGLRPYLQALADGAERADFERLVFDRVRNEYPTQSDGSIIFPFPRFFFTAVK
ncbi:ribosomal RNA large subunit methyltransferase J-like protein [Bifidobacterium callitrichos DSM 23973]|uniref:Ribosomal RNA large subunit methyltransferase J-like protein n=2 Tax=Bifidobacterium callitrichos TaxID=762209 RepID=A0A087ADA5_9BIFI|nr:ribosomal RNA large subunit methyltransferase J-like protein [Bifidobacterium callitrichos DSM 23973]